MESKDGRWSPVPPDVAVTLRRVFDAHATTLSSRVDLGPSIDANNLHGVIVAVIPEIDPQRVADYISSRKIFLQELCSGQVGFNEFLRAVSRLGQEEMMRLSRYSTTTGENNHCRCYNDNTDPLLSKCMARVGKRDEVYNSKVRKALRETFDMYDLDRGKTAAAVIYKHHIVNHGNTLCCY